MELQKFPTELLDSIFSHYDPFPNDPVPTSSHFRELRLLCTAFCRSTTPLAFKRVRLCGFNREAFERIVSLSQRPELARYVTAFEYKVVEHVSPPGIHQVDSMIQLEEDITPADSAAMACDIVARHQVFLAQADVLGTYFDILSLVRALPAFRNLRSITISAFANEPYRAHDAGATRAFWGVIKALNHCTYNITSLTIDAWHPPSLFPAAYNHVSASSQPPVPKPLQIGSALGGVARLTLSNIPQVKGGFGWQKSIRLDIIKYCVSVESLTIVINSEPVPHANPRSLFPSFRGILFDVPRPRGLHSPVLLPKLRHLELAATTDDGAHLEDPRNFLARHMHTLRSLVCRNYWMRKDRLRRGWISDGEFKAAMAMLEDCKFEGSSVSGAVYDAYHS